MEYTKPVFTKVSQICMVVDDLYAYMKRFNDDYGIGPWVILHFDPSNTTDMILNGKLEDFDIRLALCDALNVQLELIQPLSENSNYAEFLHRNGPGLHHISLDPAEGYARIREILKDRGYGDVLIGGTDAGGMEFAYIDLRKELGFIVELFNPPENFVMPPAEDTYPRQ
ncbi:MAG: VOC family protein [Propionibacteriaceae bacterium]|nr:VOC family protein [Propionibacteriaceae bacterium]